MTAIELIRKHIPDIKRQWTASVMYCSEDRGWYHIDWEEEVPSGKVQIVLSNGEWIDIEL